MPVGVWVEVTVPDAAKEEVHKVMAADVKGSREEDGCLRERRSLPPSATEIPTRRRYAQGLIFSTLATACTTSTR